MRIAKADNNQVEIVKALRAFGAYVIHTHTLKNAFDVLVGFRGKWVAMEIKDSKKLPKKFGNLTSVEKEKYLFDNKLTEGERKCMLSALGVDAPYVIVYSVDSALNKIGAK